MNCCRETAKMGVPRAAQALVPRAGQPYRGTAGLVSVPEWYVAGGACPACPGLVSGSLSKEHSRTPGFRLVEPTARREGRPYP